MLSDPSQRSRYDALRGTQSYEQATRGAPGYGRDTARAGGASAGGRAWSDAQQERAWREWQRTGGATRPPSGFSEADAERLFREVFGGVGGIADLLRKMQQQQPGRSSAGSWEDVLAQAMRSAAAGARTEVRLAATKHAFCILQSQLRTHRRRCKRACIRGPAASALCAR